jgi:hypothetical protein
MANDKDPNGIFEDDVDGGLTEFGKRLVETTVEALEGKIAESHDELTEVFDAYMEQEVLPTMNEAVDDAVAELRKLMLLAVATISGQDKTREFVRKVAELARAGALSSASGAWAQGGPADASANRDSIRGGGISVRKEEVEPLTEEYVQAISRTARKG